MWYWCSMPFYCDMLRNSLSYIHIVSSQTRIQHASIEPHAGEPYLAISVFHEGRGLAAGGRQGGGATFTLAAVTQADPGHGEEEEEEE